MPARPRADGRFTLRAVECIGGCGWATVVAVNNRHRLHVKPEDVPALAAELRGEGSGEERDGDDA